jgi:hypothetical protein
VCNGAAAVDDMSLLPVGPGVATSPGSACERAALAHGPIRTLDAQACEPLDFRTTRDVQSLRGQCPGGQKAASLTDAAPSLFGASGRRSVLSCGVVSASVAVEVLVPVAPTLRFPLV